ncbi:MAG: hypothetical protein ACRERV_12215, partial [Methylococcales bacterium]
ITASPGSIIHLLISVMVYLLFGLRFSFPLCSSDCPGMNQLGIKVGQPVTPPSPTNPGVRIPLPKLFKVARFARGL